jgi:predicted nucleic acid-binding protein
LTAIKSASSEGSTKTRQARKLSLDDALAAYLAKRREAQEADAPLSAPR